MTSDKDGDRHPDPSLLELLVCPLTKGPLHYDREHLELVSVHAALAFPVRSGIPILVEDDARVLSDDEISKLNLRRRNRT